MRTRLKLVINKNWRVILAIVAPIVIVIGAFAASKFLIRKQSAQYYIYVPMFVENREYPLSGVQVDNAIYSHEDLIYSNRIYQSPARWSDIESVQGTYKWTDWLDHNVKVFAPNPVIIGVKTVPEWARLWDKTGSPPKEENYIDYANFVLKVIERYNVWGVELFNEPDVQNTLDNDVQYYYGAWVEGDDYYGAGTRYGKMLNTVYPIIKKRYPDVKVIAGALVGEKTSFEFLKGIIDTGATADFISFHKYIYIKNDFYKIYDFARQIREITNIPIVVTETSVLSNVDSARHEELKAEYVAFLKENTVWSEVCFFEIYAMNNGYKNSDLAPNWQPAPAYYEWATP